MMICKYRKNREEKTDEKQRSDHTSFSIQCIQSVQLNAMLVMLFCNNNKSFCKIAGKYNQTSIISCSYHSFHLVIFMGCSVRWDYEANRPRQSRHSPQPATSMRITTSSPAMRLNVRLIVADKVGDSLSTAQWRQTSKDCKEGVQGEGFNYFYVCCVKSHAEKGDQAWRKSKVECDVTCRPKCYELFFVFYFGKDKKCIGDLVNEIALYCSSPYKQPKP